jgi:hypothetical protein
MVSAETISLLYNMEKITINTSDMAIIFGVSLRTAQRRMQLIKAALSKQKHQSLTIEEFCRFEGIDVEMVVKKLKIKNYPPFFK